MRASQYGSVRHPCAVDVTNILADAAEQPDVFFALNS
jgi:hypothetical protein